MITIGKTTFIGEKMKNYFKNGKCTIADKFISNKKVVYCKNCETAIPCNNGTVCRFLLDEKY
jgi:hypothetical protein